MYVNLNLKCKPFWSHLAIWIYYVNYVLLRGLKCLSFMEKSFYTWMCFWWKLGLDRPTKSFLMVLLTQKSCVVPVGMAEIFHFAPLLRCWMSWYWDQTKGEGAEWHISTDTEEGEVRERVRQKITYQRGEEGVRESWWERDNEIHTPTSLEKWRDPLCHHKRDHERASSGFTWEIVGVKRDDEEMLQERDKLERE